ncbi:hypothetical protein Aph02nite_24590 [Actinoplanes philippinensis]|uniref:Secreted protein n=1 Tax=Actinoplanes philippinensis TaxID=35752 RepID=A0A1I2G323_9ACTN|nr:hypothetical protein [Actinoplanes philippinensis]GIE76509.1 hypothetical protein Aph02nite_24590 [Actinoplanes philippinensis]SFF11156.1 hypothetical protein SAMN05421541_106118 [Actinoplanes philippinensis]
MASVLRRVAAVAAAAMTAVALAATPAHATDGNNYIWNIGAGDLGVMHLLDGVYTHGNYDQLLPQYQKTNSYFPTWKYSEGYYIGAGYCAWEWKRWAENDSWGEPVVVYTTGTQWTSRNYNYRVLPYKPAPGLSCFAYDPPL